MVRGKWEGGIVEEGLASVKEKEKKKRVEGGGCGNLNKRKWRLEKSLLFLPGEGRIPSFYNTGQAQWENKRVAEKNTKGKQPRKQGVGSLWAFKFKEGEGKGKQKKNQTVKER